MTSALDGDMTMTVTVARSPGGLMAVLKARCIARYRLHTVPGRPEELEQNTGDLNPITERPDPNAPIESVRWADPANYEQPKVISFGYLHKSVRIRQHGGPTNREWIDHRDITFRDGWLGEVYDYLDQFFDYNESGRFVMNATGHVELLLDPTKIINVDNL